MAQTGRLAAWMGLGKGFEIREYPVPDPKPGALIVRVAIANVCGSDLHYWQGEQTWRSGVGSSRSIRPRAHGSQRRLGDGVTTDSEGRAPREGDRVSSRISFLVGAARPLRRPF